MAPLAQLPLFENRSRQPSGLTYVSGVVDLLEERALTAFIETLDLRAFEYRGFFGARRTVSFGWRYDFNGGGFQRADSLPVPLHRVRAQVLEGLQQRASDFEQCSVIEYAPGAGIGWHKDRPQFGKVAGLSLLAPCRFRFRRKKVAAGWDRESLLLEPRSAYLLEGDARSVWQHSIPPLEQLRYSITFRTLAAAQLSSSEPA